jgi:hypothetical protein
VEHHSVTLIEQKSIPRGYAIGDRAVLEERTSERITVPKRVVDAVPQRPKKNIFCLIQLFTSGVHFVRNNAN